MTCDCIFFLMHMYSVNYFKGMMKSCAAVKFIETEDVETVPVGWLQTNESGTLCAWPPYNSTARITRAIAGNESAAGHWKTYEVVIIRKCDTLVQARQVCAQYVEDSDIQSTSASETERKKNRKKKKVVRYGDSSDDDFEQLQPLSSKIAKAHNALVPEKSLDDLFVLPARPLPIKLNTGCLAAAFTETSADNVQNTYTPCSESMPHFDHAPPSDFFTSCDALSLFQPLVETSQSVVPFTTENTGFNPFVNESQTSTTSSASSVSLSFLNESHQQTNLLSAASPPVQISKSVNRVLNSEFSDPLTASAVHGTQSPCLPLLSSVSQSNGLKLMPSTTGVVLQSAQSTQNSGIRSKTSHQSQYMNKAARVVSTGTTPFTSTPSNLSLRPDSVQATLMPELSSLTSHMTSTPSNSSSRPDSVHMKPVSGSDRRFLLLLEEIKSQNNTQILLLQQLLARRESTTIESDFQDEFGLPLSSTQQLMKLESDCVDRDIKAKLTRYLSLSGGNTVADTARNIMKRLVGVALAVQCNWCGKGDKYGFGRGLVKQAVCDAVRRNPATCRAVDSEVDKAIKDWLRFASDRDGGRQRRAAKKAAMGQARAN